MKYLLDTVTLLWWIFDQAEKLSSTAIQLLQDPKNAFVLSTVSSWEIAIKYSLGKLEFKRDPEECLPDILTQLGFEILPVSLQHTLAMTHLPWHHRDPFDRLLACQANFENLPILTPDPIFKKYKVKTVW